MVDNANGLDNGVHIKERVLTQDRSVRQQDAVRDARGSGGEDGEETPAATARR